MKWTRPKYSKGDVNRAGETTARLWGNWKTDPDALYNAIITVGNWRSCHAYPLFATKSTLLRRAKAISLGLKDLPIVAHRLKRLPSIASKLRRYQQMSLTQMQDIGGCRAVMPTLETAYALVDRYTEYFKRSGTSYRAYDYIQIPKSDGYRGFHFAIRYRSKAEAKRVYDGLRIERFKFGQQCSTIGRQPWRPPTCLLAKP